MGYELRYLFDSTLPLGFSCTTSTIAGLTSDVFQSHIVFPTMLCRFRDPVMHIIAEHPEQVNDSSGLNHSPLVAALYKRHFDVAELLHQHGAPVDLRSIINRTPLQAASGDGFIDVAQWLLTHGP